MLSQLLNSTGSAPARHLSRGRLAQGNLQSRHDRGSMVCISHGDQRHAGPPALSAATAATEGARLPRRSVAGGGCRLEKLRRRTTLGANYYVSPLREAVVQCLKIATGDEKLPEPATRIVTQAATAKRLPLPA